MQKFFLLPATVCVYLFEEESAAGERPCAPHSQIYTQNQILSLQDITLGAISHLFLAQPPFDMGPRALFPFALPWGFIERERAQRAVSMATPCARDKLMGVPLSHKISVLLCRAEKERELVRLMCRVLGALFVNLNGKWDLAHTHHHPPKNRTNERSALGSPASLLRFCFLTFRYWHRTWLKFRVMLRKGRHEKGNEAARDVSRALNFLIFSVTLDNVCKS